MRAAVDVNIFAGDVASFFRGEEDNWASDLEHFADTFHGDFLRKFDVVFFGAVHILANVGIDCAGTDAVDGNSVFSDLASQVFAEVDLDSLA